MAGDLIFIIKGLPDLEKRLDIAAAVRIGLARATAHVADEIKEITPANKDTSRGTTRGRLAAAWTWRISGAGNNMEGRVGNNVTYGPFVNYGTGIFVGRGPIRPVRAKALRFFIRGRAIFAQSIKGQRGQQFLKRGAEKAQPDVPEIIADAIQEHFDGSPDFGGRESGRA